MCCLATAHIKGKDTDGFRAKRQKSCGHANTNQTKAAVATLMSEEAEGRKRRRLKNKEGTLHIDKGVVSPAEPK